MLKVRRFAGRGGSLSFASSGPLRRPLGLCLRTISSYRARELAGRTSPSATAAAEGLPSTASSATSASLSVSLVAVAALLRRFLPLYGEPLALPALLGPTASASSGSRWTEATTAEVPMQGVSGDLYAHRCHARPPTVWKLMVPS